ncbi:MAG: class I SAM-dependent methyltransferase [Bacteroidetes bacterium]|nr:class I SAM-dependent methyltransferase [Bacteroidota bacterium]
MNWKNKLYEAYVSTGMSKKNENNTIDIFDQYRFTAKRIKKYLGDDKTIKIIDLGCGSGGLLYQIKQFGYENLTGIDYSSEQVELANMMGLTFIYQGDIIDYLAKSKDSCIDVIILMDVIEHFTREELINLLSLLRMKIRPTGRIIIHVPNAEGIFGSRIRFGDITHEIAFTRQSLAQIFKSTGFSSIYCFEDKPTIHSIASFFRRIVWDTFTVFFRILFAAETGSFSAILSQNMLAVISVSPAIEKRG